MKKIFFLAPMFLLLLINFNTVSYTSVVDKKQLLRLQWNKAYQDDSIEKSLIGLKWTLSYMGAVLSKSDEGINIENTIISIDLNKIGFNKNALKKLSVLHAKIIQSEEYQKNKTIDLGRFVSLLLGSSAHYYEIIGTPENINELLNNYTLLPQEGYVNRSTVALEHRIIQFSDQKGFNQLFVSKEIDSITKEILEFETIELLPNGQLRFGIFDVNGIRKNSANATHSNAGKPAKCMWCHESNINQMFRVQSNFPDYLSFNNLQSTLINYRDKNNKAKLGLKNGVDFSQKQQHTLTELLYISFMEPSAERLSLEWNMSVAEVQNTLINIPTHIYLEFPFLGNLYDRNEIERLAPFKGLPISSSVRETSQTEVNHLQQ